MAEACHLFVDHSNIWIEGKRIAGQRRHPPLPSNSRYRLDYNKLVQYLLAGRELAAVPRVYGSDAPDNNAVWSAFRCQGFDVQVLRRNVFNREKGVDMRMGLDVARLIHTAPRPGTIAIVAGDADYLPVVRDAHERGWKVEMWWWSSAAQDLKEEVDRFEPLDEALYEVGFDA